jgi:hypothetical protein
MNSLILIPYSTYLYIDLFNDYIDGNEWKRFIHQYLSKLKIFKDFNFPLL